MWEDSESSTVDSQMNSPKLSIKLEDTQDTVEESELCSSYHESGYCMQGADCPFLHRYESPARLQKRVYETVILKSFPELILSFRNNRIRSFLQ